MAGWSFCVSALLCIVLIPSAKAQFLFEDEFCRTPDGEMSTCTPVYSCKPISDILDSASQPIPLAIINLLKSYQCTRSGPRRKTPKVCCPSKPIQFDQNATPEPPNVSGHRNFNLLPKECGLLRTDDKIAHGNKTGLFEFPWMALLSYKTRRGSDFKCGATIINERYLLTAAHCLKFHSFPLLNVRIGEHDMNTKIDCQRSKYGAVTCAPPYQDLAIEKIIPHPQYDKKAFANDIGLIRLATPMNFLLENIKPVCLPVGRARTYNFKNRNVVVTGWGITETGNTSPYLLKARLPAVSLEECNKIYTNVANLNYKHLCAGGKTKSDSCGGDSGGPLQVADHLNDDDRMVQQGIVSFGPRDCGQQSLPGIYTKVAYYMDWILDNIKP